MTSALPSARTLCIAAAASAVVAILAFLGQIAPIDAALDTARVKVLPSPRGGDAVVVAIDTKSLQQDPDWPWTRDRYAELTERLAAAGARRVVFDIDFSTPRAGDADFARAIERTGLPSYGAVHRTELQDMSGVVAEALPAPPLDGALRYVNTRYAVGQDGFVRRYEGAVAYSFGPVPSLPAALANAAPNAAPDESALLDLRRDPADVPVLSFADVVSGRTASAALAGRTVFVGATATELGDEFALPGRGLFSGVLINAVAYEAAAAGGTPRALPQQAGLPLAVLIALIGIGVRPTERRSRRGWIAANLGLLAALLALGLATRAGGIVLPLGAAHIAQAIVAVLIGLDVLHETALRAFRMRVARDEAADLLASIVSRNEEGVAVIDQDGRVTRSNDAFDDLVGTRAAGRPVADVAPTLAARLQAEVRSDRLTLGVGEAARTVDARWSSVTLAGHASPYERRKEARRRTVVLLHDVTPLVRAEAAERAAREQHEAASRSKSTLIQTMSHELRTPLNAVIGFADLIRDEALGPHTAPEYVEYAKFAGDGGRRLLSVVNDVLHAARFQSGDVKATPQAITLSDIEDAVVSALPPGLAEAGGRVRWTAEADALSADPELVGLAVTHLVANALVFAGPDAEIDVSLATEGGAAVVTVADDGPGLAPDVDPERLTELFAQGDGSLSRSHDGCGVGLFLAAQAARVQSGTLTIDGKDGFTARLRLPTTVIDAPAAMAA